MDKIFKLEPEGPFLFVKVDMLPVAVDTVLVVEIKKTTQEIGCANPLELSLDAVERGTIKTGTVYDLGSTLPVQVRDRLKPGTKIYFELGNVRGWFFDKKIKGEDKRIALLHHADVLVSEREIITTSPSAWVDSLRPKV